MSVIELSWTAKKRAEGGNDKYEGGRKSEISMKEGGKVSEEDNAWKSMKRATIGLLTYLDWRAPLWHRKVRQVRRRDEE